jgi:transposase-like protein
MADRFTHGSEDRDEMEICPRCHRKRVVHLRSMARHSTLDWFKCDGCEHVFTREPAGREPIIEEAVEPKSVAP